MTYTYHFYVVNGDYLQRLRDIFNSKIIPLRTKDNVCLKNILMVIEASHFNP